MASRVPLPINEIPWHPLGLAIRTYRPRPSERIAFRPPRIVPRQAILVRRTSCVEGRAPHARTEKNGLHPSMSPLGHRAFDCPFMITLCVALRTASQCGRGDRVPPRKSPFASSPGFPPWGHRRCVWPPRGGAGSARPEGRHHANPNIARFG